MNRRKLQINKKHCKYSELEKLYDECQDSAMKTKLLAILQTWDGLTSTDVAKNLHKSDFMYEGRSINITPMVPADRRYPRW